MATLTREKLRKIEEYYYLSDYKQWYPFPKELKRKLLSVYGEEPFPYIWTEQDIWEGSRKMIMEYFDNRSS